MLLMKSDKSENQSKFEIMPFFYVCVLSVFLIIAPIQRANAILPFLATIAEVAVTTGVSVLVQKGSQYILKRSTPPGKLGAVGKLNLALCGKTGYRCAFGAGLLAQIAADGWKTEVDDSDPTNPNIKIYKDEKCLIVWGYSKRVFDIDQTIYLSESVITNFVLSEATYKNARINQSKTNADIDYIKQTVIKAQLDGKITIPDYFVKHATNFTVFVDFDSTDNLGNPKVITTDKTGFGLHYKCGSDTRIYMTDNDMYNYIIKYGDDNDILNIYNNDYSKINNITINNQTYNGGDIDNSVHNFDVNTDLTIAPTFAPHIKANADINFNPNVDIKIGDVTLGNCSKNEAGEIFKCNVNGKEITGDPPASTTNPTDPPSSTPKPTDPPTGGGDDTGTDDPPEPPPIECDANGFYKKICDWMDWTQKKPNLQQEEKPKIKDIDVPSSDNKIDMQGQCPQPISFNLGVGGYESESEISFVELCKALEMLKPIFVSAGALSAMFILTGYSRPNGTGAND